VKRRLAAVFRDPGQRQRHEVGELGRQLDPQQEVEPRVGHGRGHADRDETRDGGLRGQAGDAAQVLERGAGDVDARVGILDPVDGHLVDPQAAPLCLDEQLRVEEPLLIAHVGEQLAGGVGSQRLEAALGVAEAGAKGRVEQAVVHA